MEPIVLQPGEAESFRIGTTSLALLAGADTTDGRLALLQATLEPDTEGPKAHLHRTVVDMFFVLEGALTVRLGDDELELPAGSFAAVPPGVVHTFANRSEHLVRFLNLSVPGGFEKYLREAAALGSEGPPDQEFLAKLASRYDFEFVD